MQWTICGEHGFGLGVSRRLLDYKLASRANRKLPMLIAKRLSRDVILFIHCARASSGLARTVPCSQDRAVKTTRAQLSGTHPGGSRGGSLGGGGSLRKV